MNFLRRLIHSVAMDYVRGYVAGKGIDGVHEISRHVVRGLSLHAAIFQVTK